MKGKRSGVGPLMVEGIFGLLDERPLENTRNLGKWWRVLWAPTVGEKALYKSRPFRSFNCILFYITVLYYSPKDTFFDTYSTKRIFIVSISCHLLAFV